MLNQILGHLRRWMNTGTSVLLTQALHWRAEEVPGVTDLPAVVVAPHQDDETFGCGGVIALKRQKVVPVTIVFVSVVGGSRRNKGVTINEIIATRQAEALAAARVLGVATEDVKFLGYPDTQLASLNPDARLKVVEQLKTFLNQHDRVEVYVTFKKDLHPDHEAAYQFVTEASQESSSEVRLFEYLVWMRWMGKFLRNLTWADLPGLMKVPIHPVLGVKLQAIQAYPSQIQALAKGMLRCFKQPWEVFVQRPLPGKADE